MLRRLLLDALVAGRGAVEEPRAGSPRSEVSDAARAATEWIGVASEARRGAGELLLLTDAAADAPRDRQIGFPRRLDSAWMARRPTHALPAREGRRDPPSARRRQDPARDRRRARARLLRRASRDGRRRRQRLRPDRSLAGRSAMRWARSGSTSKSTRRRSSATARSGSGGTATPSTSSSPTTPSTTRCGGSPPRPVRRDDDPDPRPRAPDGLQGDVRPAQGLARHRGDAGRHRSARPARNRGAGWSRWSARTTSGSSRLARAARSPRRARPLSGYAGAAARSATTIIESLRTRPAGIDGSPASSFRSGSPFSSPVTSQRMLAGVVERRVGEGHPAVALVLVGRSSRRGGR